MKIKYVNTDATKGVLPVGTLGYDAYVAGGDEGRVGVGTASGNVLLAKKSEVDLKAPLSSPALTDNPTAPTAAVGTNTTQIATTEFVNAEIANDTYSKTQLDAGQLDNRYYTETEVDTNISTEITNRAQIGKNAIINGDFSIQQYPTDIDTAPVAMVNSTYQIDRFKNYLNGVTATMQRLSESLVNGKSVKSVKYTATSTASGRIGNYQLSEKYYKGEAKIFSVWVKSNNANARAYVFDGVTITESATAHSGGGGWELLTVTKTISVSATSLQIGVEIASAGLETVSITTGDYIETTMWQLEDGTVATPFEQRPIGLELSLCQRYYELLDYSNVAYGAICVGNRWAARQYWGVVEYVKKRVVPTISVSGTIGLRTSGNSEIGLTPAIAYISISSATIDVIGTTITDLQSVYMGNGSNFKIAISAEL